jgi:ADP-ribosylglycohydrolase
VERFTGLLLGTAVGDSLGLPREGLSRHRAKRLYPGALRQQLIARRGMLSDDTEHACMTAQALLVSGDDAPDFARVLAWKLRWWLLALPPAIGFGTLRSLLRLWIGFSPARSGVMSAGNGAVMRAPMIGAWFTDPDRIAPFVAASTAITHRDPRAHSGALAIAIAAHHAVHDRGEPRDQRWRCARERTIAGQRWRATRSTEGGCRHHRGSDITRMDHGVHA